MLSSDVQRLDQQLAQVSTLVDRYATTAANAQIVTAASRDNLQPSARSARIPLILLGFLFAAGQILPIWIGKELLRATVAGVHPTEPNLEGTRCLGSHVGLATGRRLRRAFKTSPAP